MNRFDHVLVPTDFSANAEDALALAAALAAKLGAKLTVVHVVQLPSYAYVERTGVSLDELLPRAEDALQRAVGRIDPSLGAEAALVHGHPAERIVEVARERGADVIVMGTHGRRGLPRALVGSVAESVVQTSPVPVITVSPRAA